MSARKDEQEGPQHDGEHVVQGFAQPGGVVESDGIDKEGEKIDDTGNGHPCHVDILVVGVVDRDIFVIAHGEDQHTADGQYRIGKSQR